MDPSPWWCSFHTHLGKGPAFGMIYIVEHFRNIILHIYIYIFKFGCCIDECWPKKAISY